MKTKIILLILLALAASLAAESKGWRIVQSLAVPGLSQIRGGHNYGYGMLAAEAGIISTLLFLDTEQDLKAREAYDYALKFAELQPGKYSDVFYRHMAKYSSSGYEAGGYNAMVRDEAVRRFPGDPAAQQQYIDANAYAGAYAWHWEERANRLEFASIRGKIQDYADYGAMATGVLIVNHLVSGLDILRLIGKENSSQVWMDLKDGGPVVNLSVEF